MAKNKTRLDRASLVLMLLCSAAYFTSYITRYNYGAVLEAISHDTGIAREGAGLVSTAAFFTYGVGQLISGFIGDRVHPRRLLTIGMCVTAICNLLMPFMSAHVPMIVIWAINGFAQALFWPPMVRIMVDNLSEANYNRACIWVSAAASTATIVIYLLASLCTALWGWGSLFYISAATAIIMTVVWVILAPRGDAPKPMQAENTDSAPDAKKHSISAGIVALMVPILFAIALQGILRDGVTQWLPSLVKDTFGFTNAAAILSGVALPVLTIICYNVSDAIEKLIKNELITSAVFFTTAALSAGLLTAFLGANPFISVLLLGIMTGCMHGVNLMLISRVPKYFGKFGKISTVSGIVNAFTYVGSATSAYLVAVISEARGWSFTVAVWLIIAAAGAIVCALTVRPWNKFRKK